MDTHWMESGASSGDELVTHAERHAAIIENFLNRLSPGVGSSGLVGDASSRLKPVAATKLGKSRGFPSLRGRGSAVAEWTKPDLNYYRHRVTDEQIAALNAGDLRVKRVHREMAQRYGELIRSYQTN